MERTRVPAEEIAARLVLVGAAIALAAACSYLIWTVWVLSVTIDIDNIFVLIGISVVLSSLLTTLIYRVLSSYWRKVLEMLLDPGRIIKQERRGISIFVFLLFGSLGMLAYLYLEFSLVSSSPLPRMLVNSSVPPVLKVNAIFVELMSFGSSLLTIGSLWVSAELLKPFTRKIGARVLGTEN